MNLHRKVALVACGLAVLAGQPRSAFADLTRVSGATLMGIPDFARYAALRRSPALNFDDVAYDDKHNVFLQVWGDIPYAVGRFFGADGQPIGPQFTLNTGSGNYGQQPYVAYSTGTNDDVFMVIFSADATFTDVGKNVFGQLVRFNGAGGTLIGSNFPLSTISTTAKIAQTTGGIAFNPQTHQFAAVWDDGRAVSPATPYNFEVWARLFTVNGTPVTGDIDVSAAPTDQRAGSIAYDSQTNRFAVVYKGETPAGGGFGIFAKLFDASMNALTGVLTATASGVTNDPQILMLPGVDKFLLLWTDIERSGTDGNGRLLNPVDGTFTSNIYPVVATPVFDGAPHGQYNPWSQSAMVAAMHDSGFAVATELDAAGTPRFAPFIATQTTAVKGGGTFYPRIAAGANNIFALTYMANYSVEVNEVWRSGAGTPAPTPTPTPTPPPANPNPAMWIDGPSSGSSVNEPFLIQGWALDSGAPSGAGVDAIHVWAWPVGGGSPTFVGATTQFSPRGDVGAVFGSRFTNSGYTVVATNLPAGAFTLAVYMHSTLTGTFNMVRTVNINILPNARPPQPILTVDTPHVNQTVARSGFLVGGWGIDLGSTSGPGMSAVHIWAYPSAGGPPVFAGAASYGVTRPDIGSIFGGQFSNSGWNAVVNNLPVGDYDLAVFGLSTVTGTFNIVKVIHVGVR